MKNKPPTSLDKALRLLRLLSVRNAWTGVRELARLAEYTPSSVHGLLQVMVHHGFVEFDGERRQYRLGVSLLTLADGMDATDAFGSFARPWAQRLAEELDETVMVLAWRGGRAVIVAAVEANHDLRVDPGRRIPDRAHVWASGQVLLAHRTDDELATYIARAGLDAAAAAGLHATLAIVREQGWAAAHDIDGSGVNAVGAPVCDVAGRCVLAVGCSAPLARSAPEQRVHMLTRATAIARDMSTALGTT